MPDTPIYLHQPGILCALGNDCDQVRETLFSARQPMLPVSDHYSPGRPLPLGQVTAQLPGISHLPVAQRTRNNALLLAAFAQIADHYQQLAAGLPTQRIAVIIGTSTSGIAECGDAVRYRQQHGQFPKDFHCGQQELGSPSRMLAEQLDIHGPAYSLSTACTSSAKALISGARLIRAGLADLVLAGGVDTLARFTIAGFSSLDSVSSQPCLPFSANRCGINIGEAAALFILSRDAAPVTLAGYGESSDGHHISAPDPEGHGARQAIHDALRRAGCNAADIGYINLHGTATPHNDAMESRVMHDLLPTVAASSTKPLTGHTLGAAGALEAALCWLTLTDDAQRLPPHWWDGVADPALPALPLVSPGQSVERPLRYALSTSFAFGGSNAALVLGRG